MVCGNCGAGNEHGAEVCVRCNATLALTEYYRPSGFVEKKNIPTKAKPEPWDQDILTAGYQKKYRRPVQDAPMQRSNSRNYQNSQSTRSTHSTRSSGTTTRPKSGSGGSATSRGQTTSRSRQPATTGGKGGKSTSSRSQNTTSRGMKSAPERKPTRTSGQTASSQSRNKGTVKKIPPSKAYNHTTKVLNLAEQEVQKRATKSRKKKENAQTNKRMTVFLVALLLIAAVGIFIGAMHYSTDEDRYIKAAEAFVEALVMDDGGQLENYVHPKMHGELRPLGYKNVARCDMKIVEYEETDAMEQSRNLQAIYGISDPVTKAFRVRVGCTIYGESTFAKSLDVVVGEIGGNIYVLEANQSTT